MFLSILLHYYLNNIVDESVECYIIRNVTERPKNIQKFEDDTSKSCFTFLISRIYLVPLRANCASLTRKYKTCCEFS